MHVTNKRTKIFEWFKCVDWVTFYQTYGEAIFDPCNSSGLEKTMCDTDKLLASCDMSTTNWFLFWARQDYIASPQSQIDIKYCLSMGVYMMTSSNGNIFRVTGPLCREFPTQRPVTRSFDVFFDLRLNKPLSKQSWGWWFETLSRSLWRHRNELRFSLFLS